MRWVALFYSVILTRDRRITSAQLMALAAELKLADPRTVLSSGNLVFLADATERDLETRLEHAASRHFGRMIPVIVRGDDAFRRIRDDNPFPEDTRIDASRVGVRVMRHAPEAATIARIAATVGPDDRFAPGDRTLWLATSDRLSGSPLLRAISAPWAGTGTLRNASALSKIAATL